jgi:hypothetical protein
MSGLERNKMNLTSYYNRSAFLKGLSLYVQLLPILLRSLFRKRQSAFKYISEMRRFIDAGGNVTHLYPILDEYKEQAGTATGHYFHQDLLVASLIHDANPKRHIDVGSRIDGFVAHVAAFRSIEVLDIRPLTGCGHKSIIFMQANLMSLGSELYEITDSLSCLHAIEHFGLGRYGDPIDPLGHLVGFVNLHKMLKAGGKLYISFPIGRDAVYFNAHRVFKPAEILVWSRGLFDLERFDYVDDRGNLYQEASLSNVPDLDYGCGIYTMKKIMP